MADYNASVALGINSPDPQAGLNTLNKIMSLGSAGLDIQAQKQALVGQAAQVQKEQLSASQAQGVQDFFKSWDPTQHLSPDGTIDADSVHNNPAYKSAGNAKPLIDQQLLQIKQGQLQNKQALSSLDDGLINRYAQTMGTLADDPEVKAGGINGQAKVTETLQNFSKLQPEAARIAQMFGGVVKNAPKGQDGISQPNLAHLVRSQQMMGADVLGQRSQQNPQALSTGAGVVNRAPTTGEITAPPGAAPGSALNPTPPQVAGATKRQTETGNADIDTSNLVVAAQKDARTNIDLTKRIDQLADIVAPGALPAKVSSGLGALGLQDINQARTELEKDLGRLRGSAGARAGSDSRAAEVLSGLPTAQTPTQTIHQAMDVTRGSARQDLALGQLREKNAASTKGQMNGFQGDYAHATAAASPLMHEYYALSPEEQVGFFQRNFKTKEQAKAFRAQAESVKRLSPDVTGQ